MKKHLFLICCALSLFASSQVHVQNNGVSVFGCLPSNISKLNSSDSVTACRIFSPISKQASRISFGNYLGGQVPAVTIGDYKNNSYRLNAFGLLGFNFATMVNDTLAYYNVGKGNYFQFNCDVRSSGLFIASDRRFKQDIEELPLSSDKLSQIRGVSFKYKIENRKSKAAKRNYEGWDSASIAAQKTIDNFYNSLQNEPRRFGFLAQDVKEVYPELVRTDSLGYMYVDYIGMIPLLVNSLNELKNKVDSLENLLNSDCSQVGIHTKSITSTSEHFIDRSSDNEECVLYQNAPNPFSSETIIRCDIGSNIQNAFILITNLQGGFILQKEITQCGVTSVIISSNELPAGVYLYSLIVDSKVVDSKRMYLTSK